MKISTRAAYGLIQLGREQTRFLVATPAAGAAVCLSIDPAPTGSGLTAESGSLLSRR
jgi:hypothetical protein